MWYPAYCFGIGHGVGDGSNDAVDINDRIDDDDYDDGIDSCYGDDDDDVDDGDADDDDGERAGHYVIAGNLLVSGTFDRTYT